MLSLRWPQKAQVVDKKLSCQCKRHKRCRFHSWIGMITWRRKWQPTPVFMPRESHGQWSLEGYRPWGCKGFPGDSLVKNPPANAREVNAIPGLGGSHMPQGNWALAVFRSHNPWAHMPHARARAPQEKPPKWGTWAPQLEQPPLTATRESPGSSEDPAQPNKLKPKRLLWMWVDQCFCLSLCFQFFCV